MKPISSNVHNNKNVSKNVSYFIKFLNWKKKIVTIKDKDINLKKKLTKK